MTQSFHENASPRRWHRRHIAFVLAGALIVSGAAAVVAGPSANAAVIDTAAYYQIVSRHSGKAVAVAGESIADGAALEQRTLADAVGQQFQFVDAGSGHYKLRARQFGKVADVASASTANGANVVQWTDNGGTNQQWQLVRIGAAPKYAGYLFCYFTGENTSTGEQVYFALSQGNDPTRWRQLGGGRPVLTSTAGTR